MIWCDPQLVHGGVQVPAEPFHLFGHVGFNGGMARAPPARLPDRCRALDVVVGDLAEHPTLHGLGEDRVDSAEILFHSGHLGRDPGEELQVSLVRVNGLLPALAHEMPHLRDVRLPVTVDAADPLLQLVGVERDVVVDEPVAVFMQVDALAGRVGGQQDPDLVLVRWFLERQPELLAVPCVHPAVQQFDPVAGQAFLGEQFP